MLCALILAGGSGKRFWPLSTEEKPKQLLQLFSEKTMVRETVERILLLIPGDRIFIATNIKQLEAVKSELPMIPEENFIVEPEIKDTAAAIGYSALVINRMKQRPTLLVLPSDHLIKDLGSFHKAVLLAYMECEKYHKIITFGIKPTRPDIGYGYLRMPENIGDEIDKHSMNVSKVEQFLEKPDLLKAQEYYSKGNYLWNSGMFVFEIKTILEEIQRFLPKHYRVLKNIQFYVDQGHEGIKLAKKAGLLFEDFEKISIDYGIMERSERLEVIPINVGWSDVGSFTAFEDVYKPDEQGNIIQHSDFLSYECHGNIILTENLEIKAIGMEDMVIVQHGSKLLICSKYELDKMKEIV